MGDPTTAAARRARGWAPSSRQPCGIPFPWAWSRLTDFPEETGAPANDPYPPPGLGGPRQRLGRGFRTHESAGAGGLAQCYDARIVGDMEGNRESNPFPSTGPDESARGAIVAAGPSTRNRKAWP